MGGGINKKMSSSRLTKGSGTHLWKHAKTVISGGTGLLSKRAELYGEEWPAYFSKCKGCEVWDLAGNRLSIICVIFYGVICSDGD